MNENAHEHRWQLQRTNKEPQVKSIVEQRFFALFFFVFSGTTARSEWKKYNKGGNKVSEP